MLHDLAIALAATGIVVIGGFTSLIVIVAVAELIAWIRMWL